MKIIVIKGASLISRKSRSSIVVHRKDGSFREVNVRDIEALVIVGSDTRVETGVIALLSKNNIPVSVVSKLGVSIMAAPAVTLVNETRRAQYSASEEERREIMVNILRAKFRGFRNMLSYHGLSLPEAPEEEPEGADLLRWEASASREYWRLVLGLVPGGLLEELERRYGFTGRRPGAGDPFNQSVSTLYALLYSLATRALLASGLDPTYGLHHRTRYSLPLVFDYTEMYKPIAVHAVVKVLRKAGRLPELDEDGHLTREHLRGLLEEFYRIMRARIRGTRVTPHRSVYLNALRLATRIRTKRGASYTYTYNPKKLLYPQ